MDLNADARIAGDPGEILERQRAAVEDDNLFSPLSLWERGAGGVRAHRSCPPIWPSISRTVATSSERRYLSQVELVGALGVEGLPLREGDFDPQRCDRHRLDAAALEMHLDPPFLPIAEDPVAEGLEIEPPIQLAVDPRQQVEVERRRHPQRIVVGGEQDALGFLEVRPEEKTLTRIQQVSHVAHQGEPLPRIQVADGGAEEEDEGAAGADPLPADLAERRMVLPDVSRNAEVRIGEQ